MLTQRYQTPYLPKYCFTTPCDRNQEHRHLILLVLMPTTSQFSSVNFVVLWFFLIFGRHGVDHASANFGFAEMATRLPQVKIVTVCLDEKPHTWQAFSQQNDMPWVNMYVGGEFEQPQFTAFGGNGLPATVIINADGTIHSHVIGADNHHLEEILNGLLPQ